MASEAGDMGHADDLIDHLVLALAAADLGTWRWDLVTGAVTLDATMGWLLGLEPATFDGSFDAWVGLMHHDDAAAAVETLSGAVSDRTAFELEHRVVWPDGSTRWLRGRGKVTVDADGNVTGAIGCSGDVTARKMMELGVERRLEEAERLAARERLQRERLEFLISLDDTVPSSADHRDLMRRVVEAAVPRLGDWCVLHFVPEAGLVPEVEIAHVDPARVDWAKRLQELYPFDPNAPTGVAAVLRTGKLEFIREVDREFLDGLISASAHIAPAEELAAIVDELQLTSVVTVPLRAKRGVVGALQLVSAESRRRYDHEDVALVQAAASRIAPRIDNAWHSAQHRTIASTLQAALLPPRLPSIDGVSLAVRYWAAGEVTEVGGDFYDVFRIDEHRWALVIGDVCGTGPDAAAVTMIARHTIRAAAKHGASYTDVIRWVNEALLAGDRDLFCTVVYATLERLDGDQWRFRSVAGGHPLPILVRASVDGVRDGVHVGTPGTLLGVLPDVRATPAELLLHRGDTLVLYTDGVTDVAPPHDLDPEAVARLVTDAAFHARAADDVAARLGHALEAELPIPHRHDDVALVVLRIDD